jgi:hypothetical protein
MSTTTDPASPTDPDSAATAPPQWQAIWAPQYNAYYFYNPVTQETTWTNPLQPQESPEPETATDDPEPGSSTGLTYSGPSSHHAALQAAAVAQGIDPGLAHLDPSLGTSLQGTSNLPGGTFLQFVDVSASHFYIRRCAHLHGTVQCTYRKIQCAVVTHPRSPFGV